MTSDRDTRARLLGLGSRAPAGWLLSMPTRSPPEDCSESCCPRLVSDQRENANKMLPTTGQWEQHSQQRSASKLVADLERERLLTLRQRLTGSSLAKLKTHSPLRLHTL